MTVVTFLDSFFEYLCDVAVLILIYEVKDLIMLEEVMLENQLFF